MSGKIKAALISLAAALSLLAAKLLASAAFSTALLAHPLACLLYWYQPKEPASIKKYCKN